MLALMSAFWFPFLMFLAGAADALANSPAPTRRPRSFREFRFAPNGVCLYPRYFVEHVATADGRTESTAARRNYFTMRNVPGDGDCVFLAVALAAATSMGLGGNDALLRAISKEMRAIVAQILESPPGTNLYVGPGNVVEAARLLQSAVQQEPSIGTAEEYLQALRREGREGGLYGGGPELAILANVLRRPISIYEVDVHRILQLDEESGEDSADQATTNGSGRSSPIDSDMHEDDSFFPIVCKGSFGDGVFEDPCLTAVPNSAVLSGMQPGAYSWRLHILVLDVSTREKHACVLLPQEVGPPTE